jgi:hypothetical protein
MTERLILLSFCLNINCFFLLSLESIVTKHIIKLICFGVTFICSLGLQLACLFIWTSFKRAFSWLLDSVSIKITIRINCCLGYATTKWLALAVLFLIKRWNFIELRVWGHVVLLVSSLYLVGRIPSWLFLLIRLVVELSYLMYLFTSLACIYIRKGLCMLLSLTWSRLWIKYELILNSLWVLSFDI